MKKKIRELARDVSFFRGISEESLLKTISYVNVRQYPTSQSVLLESSCEGSVFFIAHGWIKVCPQNHGQTCTNYSSILGRGEIIGEIVVLEDIFSSIINAVTLVPSRVWSAPARDFGNLLRIEPEAGFRLAVLMSKRLRSLNQRIRLKEAESIVRVAYLLLQLAEYGEKSTKNKITIPHILHREMASIAGLATETVTRALTKLENRSLITRLGATIDILDLRSLQTMVGGRITE